MAGDVETQNKEVEALGKKVNSRKVHPGSCPIWLTKASNHCCIVTDRM